MGFLLWGAYVVRLLWLRRYRQIAIFATAILPGLLWTMWVRSAIPRGDAFGMPPIRPLWGMVQAALHPRAYPFSATEVAVIRVLDWMQLAGNLLAISIAFSRVRSVGRDAVVNACFLFACLALTFTYFEWDDPFARARILAPLFLFQFLERGRLTRLPLLLVTPRVWLELTPQVLGILRGIL